MNGSIGPQIDWNTAQVQGRQLSVTLEGKLPKDWAKRFNSVLSVLGQNSSGWGEIAAHKSKITVAEIQEGSEADLRHLLESVVLQANAGSEPPQSTDVDARTDQERAMTERFRGFGSGADSS